MMATDHSSWALIVPFAAFGLDLIVGDPRWLPHPVVMIGSVIAWLESFLNRPSWSPWLKRCTGAAMAALIVLGSYGATWFLLRLCTDVSRSFGLIASIWVFQTALATRSLADVGLEIVGLLSSGNIAEARRKVSWIVGRDTADMGEAEICRAAVETVAENTSDGVIAPLLYGLLGGSALAMAYKAVNTLDSMVGYKSSKYVDFGWASAKLDDIANFVPARVSACLICLASYALGTGWQRPWKAVRASAHLHPSPNSGYPESAVAGALGVELGGLNYYGGIPQERARMGTPERPLDAGRLRQAVRLMVLASAIGLVLFGGVSLVVG